MKPTLFFIEKKFEEFNRQIFAGELPKPVFELSKAKSFMGLLVFNRRSLFNGRREAYNYRLRISTHFDRTEAEIEDTIIHEMIHYYIEVKHLKDSSAHGTIFRKMMNDINQRYGRKLCVSHKISKESDPTVDTQRRRHVVAIVYLKDGQTGVKVLPFQIQRIVYYYRNVLASGKVNEVKLYLTDDPYFNRFPKSSALRVTLISEAEFQPHLQHALAMKCDGNQLLDIVR